MLFMLDVIDACIQLCWSLELDMTTPSNPILKIHIPADIAQVAITTAIPQTHAMQCVTNLLHVKLLVLICDILLVSNKDTVCFLLPSSFPQNVVCLVNVSQECVELLGRMVCSSCGQSVM